MFVAALEGALACIHTYIYIYIHAHIQLLQSDALVSDREKERKRQLGGGRREREDETDGTTYRQERGYLFVKHKGIGHTLRVVRNQCSTQ
jgi:hypothetical protein